MEKIATLLTRSTANEFTFFHEHLKLRRSLRSFVFGNFKQITFPAISFLFWQKWLPMTTPIPRTGQWKQWQQRQPKEKNDSFMQRWTNSSLSLFFLRKSYFCCHFLIQNPRFEALAKNDNEQHKPLIAVIGLSICSMFPSPRSPLAKSQKWRPSFFNILKKNEKKVRF